MTAENSILLGDKIELLGFSSLEYDTLIVFKKIVGNCVNDNFMEDELGKVSLSLDSRDDKGFGLSLDVDYRGQKNSSKVLDSNIFVALNNLFRDMAGKF